MTLLARPEQTGGTALHVSGPEVGHPAAFHVPLGILGPTALPISFTHTSHRKDGESSHHLFCPPFSFSVSILPFNPSPPGLEKLSHPQPLHFTPERTVRWQLLDGTIGTVHLQRGDACPLLPVFLGSRVSLFPSPSPLASSKSFFKPGLTARGMWCLLPF